MCVAVFGTGAVSAAILVHGLPQRAEEVQSGAVHPARMVVPGPQAVVWSAQVER